MSQVESRRVLLHSIATPDNNSETDKKGQTITTHSFRMDGTSWLVNDSGDKYPTGEVVFKLPSNELPGNDVQQTTKTTTHVIRTFHQNGGEHAEVTTTSIEDKSKQDLKNVEGRTKSFQKNKRRSRDFSQPPIFTEMKSAKYSPVEYGSQGTTTNNGGDKQDGFYTTRISKTSTSAAKTSYTYKIQDGIAVLENVERQPKKMTTRTVLQTPENGEKTENQNTFHEQQYLLTNRQPTQTTTIITRLIQPTTGTQNPQKELGGSYPMNQTKIQAAPPSMLQKHSHQREIQTTVKEELTDVHPSTRNKISIEGVQFPEQDFSVRESKPGKVIIPLNIQHDSSVRTQDESLSTKQKAQKWITQNTKQIQHHSEAPQTTNEPPVDKKQFIQQKNTQPATKTDNVSSRRLAIPDFNQNSSSIEVKETTTPPKGKKQLIKNTTKQEKLQSELPPPTNKLPADKVKFLHNQETQRVKKVNVLSPGRLVIPDYNQDSSSLKVKEVSPPPKVEKRKATEEWITQTVKPVELRSELPPPTNKLSVHQLEFLQTQETQPATKVDGPSPRRLVIPTFDQHSFTVEVQEKPPPPKVEKLKTEQWITQTIKQGELRSELPPPTNKLSADKVQFLKNQETQGVEKVNVPSPGRLVIPDYNQDSSSLKVQEVSPPPKVEKRKATEEWITQTVKPVELRSELPPPTNKLSVHQLEFLQTQETQPATNVDGPSPGRLVIPAFDQHSFTVEVQEKPPPPKVEKLKTEQWITQTIKQEELRSELPPPSNKLSADKVQFLNNQETQRVEKVNVPSPGRLVIPDYNHESLSLKVQEVSPPPKVEKRKAAEKWITQTVKPVELRSELPPPTNKLSVHQLEFLQTQETQPATKVDRPSPGRLVIPAFDQHSSTVEVQEKPPPPKVEKLKTEQWITQTIKQEELRLELPPLTKKLSADKVQFLNNQETQRVEKVNVPSPGRLVIPDYNQDSSSLKVQEASPPPKVEKRKAAEEWITQTVKPVELRSELPPPTNKLSVHQLEFLQTQETQPATNVDGPSPGRLVIPAFDQHSSTVEVQEKSPPPKVEKLKTEQWITQTIKQEELRSELPPPSNKLSADKVQFLNNQETQRVEKVNVPSPGRLVIPDYNQDSSSLKVQEVSPPPKVEKRKATEEWIIQTVKPVELRSELPHPTNKLSVHQLEFLQTQETQPATKVDGPLPGRLVIPAFDQHSFTVEVQEKPLPPKVEKLKTEQWITQTIKQGELRSELPPPTNKLSADKVQFLNNQETQGVEKVNVPSPGRLVIPDYNQDSSSLKVQEVSPPPKVEKRKAAEEWITQTVKPVELRSELPPPTNKLSVHQLEFLQTQETQPATKVYGPSPGRLVIPAFDQHSSTVEVQEKPPPPKVEKLKTEQWITQTIKQEELRLELPPLTKKLSADKVQFLNNQETQRVEKVNVPSPGRLVIPDYNQDSSSLKVQEVSPPPKVEKRKATEEWITQTVKPVELRSELPPPTNKLSVHQLEFLQTQETQPATNVDGPSPGRLVIPAFDQHSSTVEVQEKSPPPKVEKLKTEQWITQTIKQEELRSELPPPSNKLSADKVQFLNNQETQRVEKVNVPSPGRLVIPDYNQESSSLKVQEVSPPPKVEKRKAAEEWITQTVKPVELRSELPPPTNKLSVHQLEFLQTQETQPATKVDGPSPGRLVIPAFDQHSSTVEVQEKPPPPKVEKLKTEQWITQTIKQEELRVELPPLTKKLSADKVQFLNNQETQRVEKVNVPSPGRLVIPDYNQDSSSLKVQEASPPPKVEKRKAAEEWITQTVKPVELRSELPPPTNKLSVHQLEFLQTQETQPATNVDGPSPGRLVIPAFDQHSSTVDVQEKSPPPKVEKLKTEQWITQTIKQEELRSELPPPSNKLSADKVQFLNNQETQRVEKVNVPSPGRLVIPDYNQDSLSLKVQEVSPPPKVEKRKAAEEWITQTVKPVELRSELPPPTNKLSVHQLEFLQTQETQPATKVDGPSPGRLVIPAFDQHSSTVEVQEKSPPLKVEKLKTEQWITQTIKQEELRSELPPPSNKLSADKVQFLNNQETQRVEKVNVPSPGRLVIPDYNQESSSLKVQEVSPPPKVEKRKAAEEWITQTVKPVELRSELPPPTNKLSVHQLEFLQTQETQPATKVDGPSPGRLVIPAFDQHSSTVEVQEKPPPPKVEKLKTEQWITQTIKQEELRVELPPLTKKLSADKVQFLNNQETQRVEKVNVPSPGRLVIPDYNQDSSSLKVQEASPPPKVEKRKAAEEWITQTVKPVELRSELPPPTKKLSVHQLEFLQTQETQPATNVDGPSPGRLVIPAFDQHSSTVDVQEKSPPPKVEKLKTEQWITQTIKQEELRSELPPPSNKLSADKVQFLNNQETQRVEKVNVPSPGRLVIPDYNQDSLSLKVQEVSPPPKVEKRKAAEEWITQTVKPVELRSELPPPTNKLSVHQLEFLQTQETQPATKVDGPSPGRLVIPAFDQHSSTVEVQEKSPPLKVEKLKTEQWITQTIKQEELRSELPPPSNKLSADKVQFLNNQESQRVEKVNVPSPGRLVIPDYNQDSSSLKVQEVSPPPKVEKRKAAEEWITQTVKPVELRSELPPPTNKLSVHQLEFLQTQETQPATKVYGPSPGRLVIPAFDQHSSTVEVQEKPPPPKVEKLKTKQWITQTIKQEELRLELPPLTKKLSADKVQFLNNQETQRVEKVNVPSPGRLVIPDYNQDSSSLKVQEVSPPPKVEKRKATEEWITQTVKPVELRSELPPPTNKLSVHQLEFLQTQETQPATNVDGPSPGRLVIPAFDQHSSTVEVQEKSPPPKVEKLKTEQWITQTIKQEELRSELPPPSNKLSADKVQFLNNQETQRVEKVNVPSPGRLVIPDYNQESSSLKVQEVSPPPKVEKRKAAEEWITQTLKPVELRSELPPPTNKLSVHQLEFLQTQETQPATKVDGPSPGRLVIPAFDQHSSTEEVQEKPPPPKVEKLKTEQWITQTIKQEELRLELPPLTKKLSADKVQFLNNQETQRVEKVNVPSPGRLVIPDYNQDTSSLKVQEASPPPKVEKRKTAEEWITQTVKPVELRSELPPPTNKLSVHQLEFLQTQETQPATNVDGPSPGRLVIPAFDQHSSTVEVQEKSPPPKVEKLKTEQWITQTIKQEELRSELPPPSNKLSADKVQFLNNQETQRVEKVNVPSPGRLVIPDYNQDSSSLKVQEVSPPPKVEKRKAAEEWITQTVKPVELRSELPPPTNKLSVHQLEFLQTQETQPATKVDGPSPGRLVIPAFDQHSSTVEVQEKSPPPKVEKLKTEQWITQTIKQEELRSELPPPSNKLSADKVQFLNNQESQRVEKVNVPSPGRLVIPDYNQDSSSLKVQEVSPPPKVEKRKAAEEWITQTVKPVELRSELPPPTNKLSVHQLEFLQTQETQPATKVYGPSPGRLVIPAFDQHSSTVEVQEKPPPPKVEKLKTKQWITQTIKQEELRLELPPLTKKLSADKVQFLNNQETQRVEKVNVPSPGRLVIPDYNQDSSSLKVQEVSPPPKVEKRKATEEWITQTVKPVELRSELPPPTNKLSVHQLEFLQTQETQPATNVDGPSPGRLVIPAFDQHSSTVEVQEKSPPPKVEKLKTEQWITQTIKQEELRSELPPPSNKLSADKVQFLNNQETQRVEKVNVPSPGRLVIPDYNQESSSLKVQEVSPPPKVEKRKAAEEWITQTLKPVELRSELPPPTNKLSVHQLEFLQTQETQPATKVDGPSPGRLVIPAFDQHSSTEEVQEKPPPPKVEKLKTEQWITQTIKQEELRLELPPLTKKLSADKVQFLNNQETQRVEKVNVPSPGRLVIPDYNQDTSSLKVQEASPPPKVEKRKAAEEWITQTVKPVELRSELPPPTNKLSVHQLEFLQTQETQPATNVDGPSPGRLVIPAFDQHSSTVEVQEKSPPPKVEKLKTEQWITQTIKQEELRSELPPPSNKLSADKVQFLNNQETQRVEKVNVPSPGRLVIPDYNQDSSSLKVQEVSPPPKVEKRKAAEEWITQTVKPVELRSELPPPTNKLSVHQLEFLQTQETQPATKVDGPSPGRLVIPAFDQHSSTVEVQEKSPPPKVEKLKTEQWITQTIKQEELRSELPPPSNKLSADKVQFLNNQETQRVEKVNVPSPGRLVIPDYNQDSSSLKVQEVSPPPKVEKRKAAEEWITQTVKPVELRSELPPPTNKLSVHQLEFLQTQETQPATKVDGPSPGRLVIPAFDQHSSTVEVQEKSPPLKVEKLKTEQWITQTIKQEELRSELPPPSNKLSADKVQFLNNQESQRVEKVNVPSPGRLVIPDYNQDSSSLKVQEVSPPPKVEKRKAAEEWITQTVKPVELRSELPPPTNKLSVHQLEFLQTQETQPATKVDGPSPGRLVIPAFDQHSSTVEVQEKSPPLKVEKLKTEQWITQTIKQEELRSELPPPSNKLSADKVQFLNNQETQRVEKVCAVTRKLVIPDYNQDSSSLKVQEVSPPPKVEKRKSRKAGATKTEQWTSTGISPNTRNKPQTIKQEELLRKADNRTVDNTDH